MAGRPVRAGAAFHRARLRGLSSNRLADVVQQSAGDQHVVVDRDRREDLLDAPGQTDRHRRGRAQVLDLRALLEAGLLPVAGAGDVLDAVEVALGQGDAPGLDDLVAQPGVLDQGELGQAPAHAGAQSFKVGHRLLLGVVSVRVFSSVAGADARPRSYAAATGRGDAGVREGGEAGAAAQSRP
jgi:hypothetical protein